MAASLRPLLSSRLLSGLLQSPCTLCSPLIQVYGVRDLSLSSAMSKDPNTPSKVGDKGPHKNYRRKVAKKAKSGGSATVPSGGSGLGSLLSGMKDMEAEERNSDVGLGGGGDTTTPDLMDVLSGLKVVSIGDEKRNPDPAVEKSCQFLDPTAGPRLDLFHKPKAGIPIKPPGRPSYAEIDAREKLKNLQMLRPWSHFNDLLEHRDLPFPRQFPIDNERYDQGEEAGVGFEDHVLLDHLLTEFPKKGPVRHFMELVLTGLSKNPHYNASEKREIVAWYKEYFDNFTPEQLQATK